MVGSTFQGQYQLHLLRPTMSRRCRPIRYRQRSPARFPQWKQCRPASVQRTRFFRQFQYALSQTHPYPNSWLRSSPQCTSKRIAGSPECLHAALKIGHRATPYAREPGRSSPALDAFNRPQSRCSASQLRAKEKPWAHPFDILKRAIDPLPPFTQGTSGT